jgi:hypothetical protein
MKTCAQCSRHIRSEEDCCPFCKAAASSTSKVQPESTQAGFLSRSALIAAGTLATGGTVMGCFLGAAVYGGPPPRDPEPAPVEQADAGTKKLAPPMSSIVPMYGVPPR